MIIVNFKRYPESHGENAVKLAEICKKLSAEYHLLIVCAPDSPDIAACAETGAACWTQKFDPEQSQPTGTLLNHSDFRLSRDALKEEVYLSKSRGDKVCICSETIEETNDLVEMRPDYIAYEPPELIGSQTTSVAEAEPEIIGQAARQCKSAGIPFLVGAGIKSASDVQTSLRQGAVGILVASAVVLADNQEQKLRELASAFSIKS